MKLIPIITGLAAVVFGNKEVAAKYLRREEFGLTQQELTEVDRNLLGSTPDALNMTGNVTAPAPITHKFDSSAASAKTSTQMFPFVKDSDALVLSEGKKMVITKDSLLQALNKGDITINLGGKMLVKMHRVSSTSDSVEFTHISDQIPQGVVVTRRVLGDVAIAVQKIENTDSYGNQRVFDSLIFAYTNWFKGWKGPQKEQKVINQQLKDPIFYLKSSPQLNEQLPKQNFQIQVSGKNGAMLELQATKPPTATSKKKRKG